MLGVLDPGASPLHATVFKHAEARRQVPKGEDAPSCPRDIGEGEANPSARAGRQDLQIRPFRRGGPWRRLAGTSTVPCMRGSRCERVCGRLTGQRGGPPTRGCGREEGHPAGCAGCRPAGYSARHRARRAVALWGGRRTGRLTIPGRGRRRTGVSGSLPASCSRRARGRGPLGVRRGGPHCRRRRSGIVRSAGSVPGGRMGGEGAPDGGHARAVTPTFRGLGPRGAATAAAPGPFGAREGDPAGGVALFARGGPSRAWRGDQCVVSVRLAL